MSGVLVASTLASLLTQAAQYVGGTTFAQNATMTPPSGSQLGDLGIVFGTSGLLPTSGWSQQNAAGGGIYIAYKILTAAEYSATRQTTTNGLGYAAYRFSPSAASATPSGFVKDAVYNGVVYTGLNRTTAPTGTVKRLLTQDSGALLYDVVYPAVYPDNTNYGANLAIELHTM